MSSRVRELTFTIDTLSDVDLSGVNTTLRHLSTKKRPVEPRHIVDFSAIARPDDRTVILRVTLDEGIFQADTTSPRNGKNFIDTNAPTTATVVMSDALDPNLDGTVTFDGTVINPAYVTLQGDHIISIDLAGGASGTYNAVGGHLLEVSGFSDVEGNPQTQDEVVGWAVDPNASSIDTGDVVPYTANLKTGILRCSRLIMQRGANIEEQLTRYLKQRGLERENIIHQALVTTHKSTLELYVLYLETVNPRLLKSFPNQGSTLSLTNPPTEYFFTYSAPLSLACIQEAGAVTYDGTNIAAESLSLTPDGQTLIVDISNVAGSTDAGLHSFEISDICGVDGVAFSAVPTYIDVTVAEVPDGDATAGGVGSNANSFGTIDAGGTAVSATGDDTLVVDGGNGIAISGDNLATSVTVTVTEAEISHDNIADTGTNTHLEIDTTLSTHTTDIATNTSGIATHLADESNPHAVTLEQARTESNALSGQITVGVSPTDSTHVATKGYVDTLVQGISWQAPVLDLDLTTPPVSPTTGDRYIVASPATGDWVGLENSLLEYDGTDWSAPVTLVEGIAAWIEDEDKQYVYNGTAWVKLSNTFDHDNLQNVGTNTHAAIDTHISSTNPHGTGIADLSDSLVPTTNGQTIEWDNDGTAWVVSSYPIISVNGATGTVVLDTDDLVEGTNLFYTDSRARAAISVTGDLAYTQATGVLDYTGPTKADLDIDHLITLSGVVAASDNLGSFTGGIISDDITVKAAIQELETDLVSKADSSSLHDAVTVTGSYDYITLAGQVITVGQVDLAADVTGLLPQASVDGLTTALAGKSDTTHMHAVDDLSDVDVVTVADNEVLQYDSTAGKWQNVTLGPTDVGAAPASHQHTLSDITDSGTSAGLDVAATGNAAAGQVVKGNDTRLTDARTPTTHTHTLSDITDSGTAAELDVPTSGNAAAGEVVKGDDSRLTDARTPTTHTHTKSNITDFNEGDYATGAEGALAASAVQPADIANFLPSIDEDDMASNSAAHLPTQQSVKAYVTAVNVDTDLGYTASTRVLTSSTGTDVTLPEATTTNSGLMSDTDKTKIDGIATGAEVNVDTDLSYTPSTRELASSTGINVTLPEAGTDPGLMAAADKTKLDGVATGAEVNVQSDWTAGSGDTFIVNKPTALSAFTDDLAYNHDNISDFDAEVNDLADARIGLANLEDLSNVNAGVGWTNGAVLKYSTSGSRWIAVVNSAGVLTADGSGGLSYSKVAHTDLDVAGLTAGDDEKVIKYDHDTTSWVLAAQTGLSDLSDVDTTGVGSGMLLKYNSTSSQFEPQTVSAENLTTNHTGSNYTPNPNNALITSHLAGIDNAIGSGGGGGISTIAAATDTDIDSTLALANDHVLYWNGTDWQNVSLKDVAVGSAKTYGDASATATTDDLNTHLTNIATSVATLGGIGDVDDSLAASGKYLKHDGAGWVASGVEVDTSAVEAFGVFLA